MGGGEPLPCPGTSSVWGESGPIGAPPSGPHPDSCPQDNQSYEEVVEGGLGAVSAISEITAVSIGASQGSGLGWHGPEGRMSREGARRQ